MSEQVGGTSHAVLFYPFPFLHLVACSFFLLVLDCLFTFSLSCCILAPLVFCRGTILVRKSRDPKSVALIGIDDLCVFLHV